MISSKPIDESTRRATQALDKGDLLNDQLESGHYRLDSNLASQPKLVPPLNPDEIQHQFLMARAVRTLLAMTQGILLILDAAERVVVGEAPNVTGFHDSTLLATASSFGFSDIFVRDIRAAFRIVMDSGQTRILEDWATLNGDPNGARCADSSRIEVYMARLTPNGDSSPTVACLFHDITERVRAQTAAELEAHRLNEHLQVFLEGINDAVLATDTDWVVTYVNPSAATLLQTSESEALGKSLWRLAPIFDCHSNRPIEDLVRSDNTWSGPVAADCKLCLPQMPSRIVTLRVQRYLGSNGWKEGHIIVLHDVTEERRRSQQDILSRKMEAIGQLAAGIAHEINTPMQFVNDNTRFLETSIARLAEVITSRFKPDEYDEDVQWTLEELPNAFKETRDGIDRVIKIVSAMKEFSHPSGGSKSPSDVNRGITATTTVARNVWKYSTHLELDLAQDLPLVFCNLDEINQVVLNLVLNAVNAVKEKQELNNSTELGHIVVSTRLASNDVVLSVQDDGSGISEDVRARIFDPFFTTKSVGKGTGQGLAVTHDVIVNKHGGRIEVESEVGRGTCFRVFLPYGVPNEDET